MSISSNVTRKVGDECRREAREAAAKADSATDPEAKKAWLQVSHRWFELANQVDEGQLDPQRGKRI